MRVVFNFMFLFLLLLPIGFALEDDPDQIIVNSQNWQDVYSGMLFGNLLDVPSNFLVSTQHATILLYSIDTERDNVLVLSDRDTPFITGYEQILESRGYDNPFEIRNRNLNLELARELAIEAPEINKYIVLDDAFGYNAISVAPYAAVDDHYVLFANEDNAGDIADFLADRDTPEVLIYGQVDREVKDALEEFSPETVNFGNRFDNNIEIVKRYQEVSPSQQVILTNGEFIEAGIMSGDDPVVFLGRENVPQSVRDYITNSDVEVGILIGNELVGSATFVRRQLGISVFVKFAQGARQPSGSIAQVEDLDRFAMPSYEFDLDIASIVYNRGTGSLEVTYENPVDLPLFFRSTITIRDDDEIKITGDEAPVFLDGQDFKTVIYRFTNDGDPLNLQADDLSGDVFTVYGEGASSLENTLQESFEIDIIDVLDDAQVNITDLYYDTSANSFFVYIENVGDVDSYVDVELIDLIINGEEVTVSADETILIPAGEGEWIPVEIEMVEEDFAENEDVRVRAYFGERELALVNIVEEEFELRFGGGNSQYIIYALVLGIVLWLLWFLGTKKKCPKCGHKNPRGRKTCEKCGHKF